MKKYIASIIALAIDIVIFSFRPELTGIRLFFQVFFYFSLLRILFFKTDNSGKLTNILLKWTLGIGLLLPVFLIKIELLVIDQFYIADLVILVPILFNELMKKDNEPGKENNK